MSRIRVLIVDDAVVVRKVVSDALATDPELEIVGTAANGRIALSKIGQLKPDVMTLDVEMPELDGLETLRELRKLKIDLPVIMFSTLTERGATATLEALTLGASDYVTKPSNVGSVTMAQTRIREELIPKIKALCGRSQKPTSSIFKVPSSVLVATTKPLAPPAKSTSSVPSGPSAKPALKVPSWGARSSVATPQPSRTPPTNTIAPLEILVVAASTGGPNALTEFFAALGSNFPLPIVLVQHMPPMFTRLLAERLTSKTGIPVAEGVNGGRLEPGKAWIAPGDYHMSLGTQAGATVIQLSQEPAENGCRPAADVLFRSAARLIGAGVLGVVLTGMGQDGLRGTQSITERGGKVLVQDEASSVVWGMPGFISRAGLADKVLPLKALGPEVIRRAGTTRPNTTAMKGRA